MCNHSIAIVSAGHGGFEPSEIAIEVGDSITWDNQTGQVHTATAYPGQTLFFDTEDIPAGSISESETFDDATGASGIEYYCKRHPAMQARIVVRLPQTLSKNIATADAASLPTFPTAIWQKMAHIVCATWVWDMADDFVFSMTVHRPEDNAALKQAYGEIEAWWAQTIAQPTAKILDRALLISQQRERSEVLGRKLRSAYVKFRPQVFRAPWPDRPDDPGGDDVLYPGQSSDPFGKAITVNHAPPEIRRIEPLEENFAGPGWRIEQLKDDGQSIPANLQQRYEDAKALVLPEHYHLLANHLYNGLTALFGDKNFDEGKFQEGIWRMTVRGEWDGPVFVGWHWMRWIQTYLDVLSSGVVTDMFRPMPRV